MNSKEKRQAVVNAALTRKGKNTYTQNMSKRDLVEDGYGDCSSTVRYWYKKLFNINIGGNTGAQYISDKMFDVENGGVSKNITCPDINKLKLGDLIYFRNPKNTNRKDCVGHVEMYIGNGKIFGHGSGIGGTVKDLKGYCEKRKRNNSGYLKTRRVIKEDESEIKNPSSSTPKPSSKYTQDDFIADVKKILKLKSSATNLQVFNKTVTLSIKTNRRHALVLPLQKYLKALGYYKDNTDGCFGKNTEKAAKLYQEKVVKQKNKKYIDGIISARGYMWKKLLKL